MKTRPDRLRCLLVSSWFLIFLLIFSAPSIAKEKDTLDAALKQLRASNPDFTQGLNKFDQGDRGKALETFRKCLDKMPRHAYAHYYLANIFYLQQDFTSALPHMQSAMENFDFMQELSEYADDKKIENMESLRRVMEEIDEASYSCREARKIEFIDMQLTRKESKVEDNARHRRLTLQRLEAQYRYFYGNIFFQLKRVPEALKKYQEAIDLDPLHAGAYNNIIAILYLAEQYPLAWNFLQRAEKQGLDESLNLKLVEMVYKAMNKPTSGILMEEISIGGEKVPGIIRFALSVRHEGNLLPPLYINSYVVYDRNSQIAVIIDPGEVDSRIENFIGRHHLDVKAVLITHGHSDHTGAARYYANLYKVPVFAHESDLVYYESRPDAFFEDGDRLEYGEIQIHILHTPGHSPGSVCFLVGDFLFSGDTLFRNDIGRIQTAGDRSEIEIRSRLIEAIRGKLLVLPDSTRVCPGHGKTTTIGDEKANNPFLK